jgi:hypothetical protein
MGDWTFSYGLEGQFDGVNWTAITDAVIDPIFYSFGIFGSSIMDRAGEPGELRFTLRNGTRNSAGLEGYYSPGHANCRSGFGVGLALRVRLTMDGDTRYAGPYWIPKKGISVETGKLGTKLVRVTAKSWMQFAANHKLQSPAFSENVDFADAAALIMADTSLKQPASVIYYEGESTFRTFGDMVRRDTTVLTELSKLVLSELGSFYERSDGLVIEGRMTRNDEQSTPTQLPLTYAESSQLTDEDGDVLTDEDGTILLDNESTSVTLDNSQVDSPGEYAENYYNRVEMTAYPRIIDAAATTELFTLSSRMKLAPDESAYIRGVYRDPSGVYKNVAGTDMVTPLVSGTHYSMNTARDGSGSDITSDLTATATFTTSDVVYYVKNNGAVDGYVTLKAVGRGVYTPDPVSYVSQDDDLVDDHDLLILKVDMKYQDDPMISAAFTPIWLNLLKNPKTEEPYVLLSCTKTAALMRVFFWLEPGMRFTRRERVTGIANDYFVQGKEVAIEPGGNVHVKLHMRSAQYDTFKFAKWDTLGTWDSEYGWDF